MSETIEHAQEEVARLALKGLTPVEIGAGFFHQVFPS